jgi:hypothetical protein
LPAAEPLEYSTGTWLPLGKRAGVCFSIDDIHPATSAHLYEAGGDLEQGALGHLLWLAERHPVLKTTLFVTPDWREMSPVPTRMLLSAIPMLHEYFYLTERWPKRTMALDRHPQFVAFLNGLPNVEMALHGLHHCAPGTQIPVEFLKMSYTRCREALKEAARIVEVSSLRSVPGMAPPGWHASPALLRAMGDVNMRFVASSRDIRTEIAPNALGEMSGLAGLPLIQPCLLRSYGLVHIPTNFQATSDIIRAEQIIECGGLLSIKAHIVKNACGHIARDGLDAAYAAYLDTVLSRLEDRYAESLWFCSMSEVADRLLGSEVP